MNKDSNETDIDQSEPINKVQNTNEIYDNMVSDNYEESIENDTEIIENI